MVNEILLLYGMICMSEIQRYTFYPGIYDVATPPARGTPLSGHGPLLSRSGAGKIRIGTFAVLFLLRTFLGPRLFSPQRTKQYTVLQVLYFNRNVVMNPRLVSVVTRNLAGAIDVVAARFPKNLALLSPFQHDSPFARMTYEEMQETTSNIAAGLSSMGVSKGGVVLSDLPNVSENLLLQIACSRIGAGYAAMKDAKGVESMMTQGLVSAICVADPSSDHMFKDHMSVPLLTAASDNRSLSSGESFVSIVELSTSGLSNLANVESFVGSDDGDLPLGFYNSMTPLQNGTIIDQGATAANTLSLTNDDKVCVSITLCHAFGIGSACSGALTSGSAVVLPAVGGLHGCGVPSKRAEATLQVLRDENCSILFADTHTLKALPDVESGALPSLRGGVVKIGSGSDFLEETRGFAGVEFRTLGKSRS